MLPKTEIRAAVLACTASLAAAQGTSREALAALEWGGDDALAQTQPLRERAARLDPDTAAQLRARLAADPRDLTTRMVLLFYETPELRRQRRAPHDPQPHGDLVLGLIEQHPRSHLAGSAGLLLYPYKRDGMYTGPAWEQAIALWQRLAAEHPEDSAIAGNAGAFLMADPFRLELDGAQALALLQRARQLVPREPRWALKLGAYHWMRQSMTREPEARAAAARAGLPHLRAAWDLSVPVRRAALEVFGQPLSMLLARAYLDAGENGPARTFAERALEDEDRHAPRGNVVFAMHDVLGRIALDAGDLDLACRHLLAAGDTSGSPTLGSFGPDFTLAKALLAAGRREAVRQFLERCRAFWDAGEEKLESWLEALDAGRDPWAA